MPFANEEPLSLLDAFSEAAPVGLAFLDRDLRFVRVNQALADMNRVSLEQHIGRTVFEILPQPFVQRLVPLLRRVLDAGEALRQREITIETPGTGQSRHHLESYYPVRGAEGHVEGVGVVVVDITERKEAEVRLQSLAEAIPQMIFTADASGTTRYCNERWFKYTGLDPVQGLGRFMRWKTVIHPDDLERCVQQWLGCVKSGGNYEHEFRVRRHDGCYRWHLGRAVPVRDARGAVADWFGSLTDIHDRQEAEALQRLFAEAGRALNASLDNKTTLGELARLVAPAFADYCIIDLCEGEGRLTRVAVAHADPERVRRVRALQDRYPLDLDGTRGIARVLRTGQPEYHSALSPARLAARALDADHRELLLGCPAASVLIMPLKAHGRVLGTLSLAYEQPRNLGHAERQLAEGIGERASLAIENTLLYEEARQANRLKDEFLATLSHELRTPLNVILGWSEVLAGEAPGSPLFRQGLEAITRNAQLQSELVGDLLDVSRIVAGKLKLRREPIDLGPIARAAVDSFRVTGASRGIALEVQAASETPLRVLGDASRLQQVIVNLLSNSIKFTKPGGAVRVRLDESNERVVLTVADTGEGIEASFLPYVFDRFRQQNSTTTRKHGGLGLGLSIVRQIVEMHGGAVTAASPGAGRGSTFTVSLPKAGALAPLLADRAQISSSAPSLRGLRIVAADDSADSRQLIRALLEKAGAEVRLADSAGQAFDFLQSFSADLLVSDIGMPEEDGLSLLRRLRAAGCTLPAIALTAYARDEERRASFAAGFQAHLAKPVDPVRLIKTIALLCNLSESA